MAMVTMAPPRMAPQLTRLPTETRSRVVATFSKAMEEPPRKDPLGHATRNRREAAKAVVCPRNERGRPPAGAVPQHEEQPLCRRIRARRARGGWNSGRRVH